MNGLSNGHTYTFSSEDAKRKLNTKLKMIWIMMGLILAVSMLALILALVTMCTMGHSLLLLD